MSRVLAGILAALLLGALMLAGTVVSAGEFPEFPYVTKEEAKSLGLILSFTQRGDIVEGSNQVSFVQDFICPHNNPEYPGYIRMAVFYFTDNEAVEQFKWFVKQGKNSTDRVEDIIGFWDSEKKGTRHYNYKFTEGPGYAELMEVETDEYYDGREIIFVKHEYEALVGGHYLVSARNEYIKGKTVCDLEGPLPVLMNLYLSRMSDNDIRVPENVRQGNETQRAENRTERMNRTIEGLKSLGASWGEPIIIRTPKGNLIKILNSKTAYHGKSSALGWKFKYYGNKALDTFIDQVANYLPKPLGLFKDYFKADKDINLFSDSEAVKKTAKDLHVDEKSASLYNDMSDIENREKAISPYKNAVPSTIQTKPIEVVLNSMGVAIKKTLAQDYRWEFEETAKVAVRYKKAGLKYKDIIRNTIDEMRDTTMGMHRVNMMNRNSKGDFTDQEARIRLYLNELYQEGKI